MCLRDNIQLDLAKCGPITISLTGTWFADLGSVSESLHVAEAATEKQELVVTVVEKASLEGKGERKTEKGEHSRPTGRSREKNPHFRLLESVRHRES